MLETDSTNFIVAISFTTAMIGLVIFFYAYHLVVSNNHIRKARRLADAAIEFTPAFITIVFDERGRAADFKMRQPAFAEHFCRTFLGKQLHELSFLPQKLLHRSGSQTKELSEAENERVTAPLQLPDGSTLYMAWEMQDFTGDTKHTDFRLVRGYDITAELLRTQKKLQALSATSSEDEERQRKRIAEDLHDRIGEILITSARLLENLKKKSPSPEITQELDELDRTIERFTKGTRTVISDLVPPVLYNVGFVAALEALAEELERRHNITIQIRKAWGELQTNQEVEIFLYKAVREFIHNALKHGGADEILVALSRAEHTFAVAVHDNGAGFAVEASQLTLNTDSGFGLFNVKNRAEYYGGGLAIAASHELGGGQITVWLPQLEHGAGHEH